MSKNRNMHGYYALRWKILLRDDFTCRYCGQHAPDTKLEVDHIQPIEEGGSDNEDNLITSCYACNRGKSALRIMVSRRTTTRPLTTPVTLSSTTRGVTKQLLDIVKDQAILPDAQTLANQIGTSANLVRVMLFRLRKRGLIPPSNKPGGRPSKS